MILKKKKKNFVNLHTYIIENMAEELDNNIMNQPGTGFDDATMPDAPGDHNKLVTLEALEHIRRRPGM